MKNISNFDFFSNKIFELEIADGFGYWTFIFYLCLSYVFTSYNIKLIKDNGKLLKIPYHEDDNEFISLYLSDSGHIDIDYEGTFLQRILMYISPISLVMFLIILLINNKIDI